MNVPYLFACDLLAASEVGPVFRSLLLPARNPSASVDFFTSFGFRETATRIDGVPRALPTAQNEWHTLIFYHVDNSSFWTDPVPTTDGVTPRFVCTGGGRSFSSSCSPLPVFDGAEAIDPDGRLISFVKPNGLRRITKEGLLCWVDSNEAFQHTFIRIDLSCDKLQATTVSILKQSGSLYWPPGRILPVDERTTLLLDPHELAELIRYLQFTPPELLGSFGEEDHLVNHTYYRFIVLDEASDGLEITAPLSQMEKCFARLNSPLRVLLGWR